MKIINKLAILSLILSLGVTSCDLDRPASEKIEEGKEQIDPENEQPQYEGFEGYTFILDQNPSEESGWYQYHSESPQARLVAISPDGVITRDVLSANGKSIDLGYECHMQVVDGKIVVFAQKTSATSRDSEKKKVTVIDAKTLDLVKQFEYSFEGQSLARAVNGEKAFLVNTSYELYTLDLMTQELSQVYDDADTTAGSGAYNGEIFLYNSLGESLDFFSITSPEDAQHVEVSDYINTMTQVNDSILLAKGNEHNYLISMASHKIVKTFDIDLSDLFFETIVYDHNADRLYVAGKVKGTNRDKVFFFDLSQENPERQLFFTIPASELSNQNFAGNTKIGFNPDKNEMYFAYMSGNEDIPNDAGTGSKSIRVGYVSRISLNNPAPYTAAATSLKIDDMVEFSPIFFNPKKL